METKMMICGLVLILTAIAGNVWAADENINYTYYGVNAGVNAGGYGCSFFGLNAGYGGSSESNSGQYDTFLGHMAGYLNTTGHHNNFMGSLAGFYNTTGSYNNIIGVDAGLGQHNLSTGSHNNFMGYRAGYKNTSGSSNNYTGSYAGYDNTTGSYNNFSGYAAGYKNIASLNNFSGTYAGYNNTSGTANNFSGAYAGLNNTTGSYNTYLGYAAGYNSNGSGNVFIGNFAGAFETDSNKLYIANSYTSVPLIEGDFATGVVTVNGAIVQTSSRAYKDNIRELSGKDALDTFEKLKPVTYVYKSDRNQQHVGFIAEDVPELVAAKDHKGLSSMDVVAVLTKVVQEQHHTIQELQKNQNKFDEQQKTISALSRKISELEQMLMMSKSLSKTD